MPLQWQNFDNFSNWNALTKILTNLKTRRKVLPYEWLIDWTYNSGSEPCVAFRPHRVQCPAATGTCHREKLDLNS